MVDIVREIEATQREVGSGQLDAGEGHSSGCGAPTTRRSRTSGTP